MIYSKTCEYALRALGFLATRDRRSYTMVSEISQETGMPGPYVAKIFQGLVRAGILRSRRGAAGGFYFQRKPELIRLHDIVKAVDDVSILDKCVMGLEACSSERPCPLHSIWSKAKQKIKKELKSCTLVQLVGKSGKLKYRAPDRSRLNASFGLRHHQ
jgi:Rrf2 family transcriptional regulator, iron-sulfur cluster assembly transcription factor